MFISSPSPRGLVPNFFLVISNTRNYVEKNKSRVEKKKRTLFFFFSTPQGTSKKPIIYSSINRTLKALQISHSTLLYHINNNYIYNSKFILSFEPVITGDFEKYTEKPVGDNQLRKHVAVYNLDNELVTEFKSGREMAKYFQIDGKIARAAIANSFYRSLCCLFLKWLNIFLRELKMRFIS